MNMSSYLMSSSSCAASSPIASKSPGTSGASERLGSRIKLEASSFNAASASQVRLKDAYLGRLKEEQQGDLRHEREASPGETDDSGSEPWNHKPAPQNNEACGKPLAGSRQKFRKVKVTKKSDYETLPCHIATSRPLHE